MSDALVESRDGRLLAAIEDELFAMRDEAILAQPHAPALALAVRAIADRATKRRPGVGAPPLRQSRRAKLERPSARRAMVRELLVADPRARRALGQERTQAASMTDEEIDVAFARLVELGILQTGNE
jgi:hypothetical protein